MSVEKKSLINNMSATKKAIIASSPKTVTPVVSNKLAGKKFLAKTVAGKIAGKKLAGKLAAKVAAKRAAKFVY
jgi:hypothetical protein